MKRTCDLLASGAGLLLLWPLLGAIALAVWLTDGSPVFYRQKRIGRGGRPFKIWKFRTMLHDAESRGLPLTVGADPRITPIGRILRKTKLDELPQLFNVWTGEMSLVGPRPEASRYVALYTPAQRRVLELTPGITDVASIEFCDENEMLEGSPNPEAEYIERVMPEKIRLNLEYAATANPFKDLLVVIHTFTRVASPWRMRTPSPPKKNAA